ncbi:MAG TPA: peptidylprolyl isomerase [Gammaproteobacteria bacterium]|nr:peptidylprolyl isomerase [Gammaproteobacteria bacterium]
MNIVLHTNLGAISIELYPEKAPKTVDNFLEYVNEGFYDGTLFHRVIDGFMIQGGGYTRSSLLLDKMERPNLSAKKPHPGIPNEANNGLKNQVGSLAMARTTNPHSATSQFFINVVNNSFLDHVSKTPEGWGYCVFGQVTDGMNVVNKIAKLPTLNEEDFENVPKQDVIIEQVEVLDSNQDSNQFAFGQGGK